jgi:hypothetical protein
MLLCVSYFLREKASWGGRKKASKKKEKEKGEHIHTNNTFWS